MAHCKVYGNKPDQGPGQLSAQASCDSVNEDHPTWKVTIQSWDTSETVYTSAVASADELEQAFSGQFPGYHVVGY